MIWDTILKNDDEGKVLYTNGCSFTLGAELNSSVTQSWPSILGEQVLSDIVINQARCGASNYEILRKTMDFLLDYIYVKKFDVKDLTVVIGWSLISRFEFYDGQAWMGVTPNMVGGEKDDKMNGIPTQYYGLIQSNEQDVLQFLWQVTLLQNILKKHNINYFFFKIDDGQVEMWNQIGEKIIDGYDLNKLTTMNYLKEIDVNCFPSIINNELTFREFALKNASLKPEFHPDEKAHKLFAKYIKEELNA